jgi:4'-phosphopantetheinyl transferase EntD
VTEPAREIEGTPLLLVSEADALALGERALAPEEREKFASFAFEKRRSEWLIGRVAAKAALARELARAGESVPPDELLVREGPDGAPEPFRRRASGGHDPIALGLTLTHGHGLAAAWALAGGFPGADLERIRERPVGTFRFYLDERERAPLLALDGAARDAAAVVLWSLKEAAWKTLRPPRGVGIIDFEIVVPDLTAPKSEANVSLRGAALEHARKLGVSRVRATYRRDAEFVYAWAEALPG